MKIKHVYYYFIIIQNKYRLIINKINNKYNL